MNRFDKENPSTDLIDEAVDWLVKLRGAELSEAETRAFADWLSEDAEHAAAFANAERFFNEMVTAARHPCNSPTESAAEQPTSAIAAPSGRFDKRWLSIPLALAAGWLIAVTFVLPGQTSLWNNLLSDYHTETGEIRDIELVDGSRLLLNTNTAISVDFQPSQRIITLYHGQARFTVAKDVRRPFTVKAGHMAVKALGTVFDIYRKDAGSVIVTVQEHAVEARMQNAEGSVNNEFSDRVTVQQGQQLDYRGGRILPKPMPVNTALSSAWQQHRLVVNDRPLSELLEELGRYRMGRIYLADERLKKLRVTGVFPLDNPDEVITAVRQVLALQETRLGPWWVLLHR